MLYQQGLKKLYTEIDLLEVVKQLRILRFMSSVYLTKTQRELIKFQHDYMLCLKKSQLIGSQVMKEGPVESFDPNENEVDAKLYKNIVDRDWLRSIREQRERSLQEDSSALEHRSASSGEDSDPPIMEKTVHEFNSNIDEFLNVYKHIANAPLEGTDPETKRKRPASVIIDNVIQTYD